MPTMAGIAEQEMLFTFELGQAGLPDFQVVSFEGHEAVSQLFRFDITLVCDSPDVDLDRLLNCNATLHLWSHDRSTAVPYHGMLSDIEQLGQVDNYCFYRTTLVPRLWRLGLTLLNDVYLDEERIPEVVRGILERNSLKGPDVRITVKNEGVYRQRSFVCQYQETDLNFISRWMEHEGLYYFFDHDNGS